MTGESGSGRLAALQLPRHWMRALFGVLALRTLQRNVASLRLCAALTPTFPEAHWLRAQHALACYNLREFDTASQLFQQQLALAPSRLDDLDAYSNILYVQEDAAKLSLLARNATKTDRYRPETCNIVGNYYSMKGLLKWISKFFKKTHIFKKILAYKGEHVKAVGYFKRSLRLDPHNLSAWTLMGHEYMELKNTEGESECR